MKRKTRSGSAAVHGLDEGLHAGEIVGAAQIAGIADHPPALEAPLATQRVGGRRHRADQVVVGPVVDDGQAIGRDAPCQQVPAHRLAQGHVLPGRAQRPVAHASEEPADRAGGPAHAQRRRDLGEEVLAPGHELGTLQSRHQGRHHRQQRRIGLGQQHVAARAPPAAAPRKPSGRRSHSRSRGPVASGGRSGWSTPGGSAHPPCVSSAGSTAPGSS